MKITLTESRHGNQHQNRAAKRARTKKACQALMETMEPRLLLSGTYLVGDITGTWSLAGLDKAGALTFNGTGGITAGSWTNQDGSPVTQVVPGINSVDTVGSGGAVGLTLTTVPTGGTVNTTTTLTGTINATKDVVALNDESTVGPLTTINGLELLVQHNGTFATADLAGTWNIAAQDLRGTVTINAQGHITGGQVYLETNQQETKITGGTANLNVDGTGALSITTGFTGANSAFGTLTLGITMNTAKDTLVANDSTIGQAGAPAEMAVLLKSSGTYKPADIIGTTWTLSSAQGAGTFTFMTGGKVSGTITKNDGTTAIISGNYTLGGNGTLITNLTETSGGTVRKLSLFGAVDRSKNLIALDRGIQNPQNQGSSLTILTNASNHAPTERALAVLPQSAFQATSVSIDYPTLLAATSANDLDKDPLSCLITDAPAAAGTLSITHDSVTVPVVPGTTLMVEGDTLTWTPAAGDTGQVDAFSVIASDGTVTAANPTQIVISTSAIAVVSAVSKGGNVLEADAGTSKGRGSIVITRAGGDQSQPLTVTLGVSGDAQQGVNYNLIAPDGHTIISAATATVTIPAGQNSVTLTLVPLQDNVVDPTLHVAVTVLADPDAVSPFYTPSAHAAAHVDVIDGDPLVTITDVGPTILEGAQNVRTFIITRLPAQGGNINGSLTVNLAYSGTFDVADDLTAPASVTFGPGEVKKVVTLSTTDDGVAETGQTLIATISGTGFAGTGTSATVHVIDASPVVGITAVKSVALEAQPATKFGEFIIHRTGSTVLPLTVDFSTAAGGDFGTQGTHYILTDASGNTLTTSVVIPANSANVEVILTPIDDFANDPTLNATVTLQPDATPSYHIAPNFTTGVVEIINNNRFPTIANNRVTESTTLNTALSLSFDQLVSLIGASLATGETNGTLQLEVTASLAGTLQVIPSGGIQTAAGVGTVLSAGDVLIWTPPTGLRASHLPAFTLSAVDGVLQSLHSSLFLVSIP